MLLLKRRKRIQNTLDITPLIDVVFQLIIFFMLTGAIVMQEGIELELPSAKEAHALTDDSVTVSLTADGGVYFKKEKLDSLSMLTNRIENSFSTSTNKAVIVKSDAKVSVDRLVSVMDHIRLGGVNNISLATEGKTD